MSLFADIMQDLSKATERLGSREASEKITKLLNDKKTVSEAKKKFPKLGEWPLEPTSAVKKFYEQKVEQFWKGERKSYPDDVEFKWVIVAKKGTNPSVKMTLTLAGQWKGGTTRALKVGESLADACKTIYGTAAVVPDVIKDTPELRKIGERKIQGIPAGFPVSFPSIWVLKNPLPAKNVPKWATVKAQQLSFPPITEQVKSKFGPPLKLKAPGFTIICETEIKTTFTGRMTGSMSAASLSISKQEAAFSKAIGPIAASYTATLDPKKNKAEIEVTVLNKKIGGYKVQQKIALKSGRMKFVISEPKRTIKLGSWEIIISSSVTIDVRVEKDALSPAETKVLAVALGVAANVIVPEFISRFVVVGKVAPVAAPLAKVIPIRTAQVVSEITKSAALPLFCIGCQHYADPAFQRSVLDFHDPA